MQSQEKQKTWRPKPELTCGHCWHFNGSHCDHPESSAHAFTALCAVDILACELFEDASAKLRR